MYGMTFSEKIAIRCTEPPENMSNQPRIPPDLLLNSAVK